ncbi:MAG TPA: PP2C family protein-serine/threonine phosphatase [Acidimicrobiia bacterium]|nr:PP2C family protein-serine/threonine phosphatase [Acidimicrobiia bacterium]
MSGVLRSTPGAIAEATAGDDSSAGTSARQKARRPSLHSSAIVVLVVGLAITAALSLGARSVHDKNEDRLLNQRVREVATVASAAIPGVETPLASAALLADETNGRGDAFKRSMARFVGAPGKALFVSASLWPARSAATRPLVVVGPEPELLTQPPSNIGSVLSRAMESDKLTVQSLLTAPQRRLGYAFAETRPQRRFIVYAEQALPKDRRAAIDRASAFADLGYELFLGPLPDESHLLASSTGGALLHGRRASVTVPFGDTQLLVVMSPHKQLGGTLLARLPLALAALGLLLTAAAVWLVERLNRRRKQAEALAEENGRLYAEQRSVAETLQHSLLADVLPEVAGLEIVARYVAGVEGMDVGGDWYDVIPIDDSRAFVVVGDVSGRGLHAATMMASLRYSMRAYAAERHSPAEILHALSNLLSVRRDGHFATVLCGLVDVERRTITCANAGHPEPLVVDGHGAQFIRTTIGVPIGVRPDAHYDEVTTTLPLRATIFMYTDGLVERRGEVLDVGLQRLADAAVTNGSPLDEVLGEMVARTIPQGSDDDAALIGVRWRN